MTDSHDLSFTSPSLTADTLAEPRRSRRDRERKAIRLAARHEFPARRRQTAPVAPQTSSPHMRTGDLCARALTVRRSAGDKLRVERRHRRRPGLGQQRVGQIRCAVCEWRGGRHAAARDGSCERRQGEQQDGSTRHLGSSFGGAPRGGGFTVGTVARYTSGQAWARRATIRNMTLGDTELVWVEPRGTRRLPAIKQIDLRVEKRFSLGRSRQLGISGDVFNLTNQGVPNSDLL